MGQRLLVLSLLRMHWALKMRLQRLRALLN